MLVAVYVSLPSLFPRDLSSFWFPLPPHPCTSYCREQAQAIVRECPLFLDPKHTIPSSSAPVGRPHSAEGLTNLWTPPPRNLTVLVTSIFSSIFFPLGSSLPAQVHPVKKPHTSHDPCFPPSPASWVVGGLSRTAPSPRRVGRMVCPMVSLCSPSTDLPQRQTGVQT